ncbi:hypothetical protein ACP70R_017651 [Stipagrostis hirtigluma subsp. patula]
MEAGERKKGASDGGGGLEWELERQYAFEREMMLTAPGAGQRKQRPRHRPLAADLLQNCDLPPPAKLFGPVPTLQRLQNAAETDKKANDDELGGGGGNEDLLRALRLSQSRARKAEERLAAAGATNGELAARLVRDSVALSAHRRWVMMLEAENSLLRLPGGGGRARGAEPDPNDDDDDEAGPRRGGVAAWWVALAVCVGIAGVGLALGRFLC